MRKRYIRLAVLVSLTAVFWLSVPSKAAADCVSLSTMFDAMGSCDSAYTYGAMPYYDLLYNNPNHCATQATADANAMCANPSTCWDTAYANSYNACVLTSTNNYYTEIGNYGTCLYNTENPACFERVDFCDAARSRAAACEQFVNDECCVYQDCLNASGIWSCE
jgi:hypothetical protein